MMKVEQEIVEHSLNLNDFATKFAGSHIDVSNAWKSAGLTNNRAAQLLAVDGRNQFTTTMRHEHNELLRFLRQFTNVFMLLLLFAALLSFVLYALDSADGAGDTNETNLYLGIILSAAVVATCTVSYFQERQVSRVVRTIREVVSPVVVIRDGRDFSVDPSCLVVGDVVRLAFGQKVPADLRLIAVRQLRVDVSSLNEESALRHCTTYTTHQSPNESRNIVFHSSLVAVGEGLGVVLRTGDRTMTGSVRQLTSQLGARETTTMQRELQHFVRIVAALAVAMGLLFFIVGISKGEHLFNAAIFGCVTMIVVMVPQGLPATVSSLLSIAARRLISRNMLLKRLDIVDTLGCMNLIACSKSALTQNQLFLRDLWIGNEIVHASLSRSLTELQSSTQRYPVMVELQRVATHCNAARWATSSTVDAAPPPQLVGLPIDLCLLQAFGAEACVALRDATEQLYSHITNTHKHEHIVVVSRAALAVVDDEHHSSAAPAASDQRRKRRRRNSKKQQRNASKTSTTSTTTTSTPPPSPAPPAVESLRAMIKATPESVLPMLSHYLDARGHRVAVDRHFLNSFNKVYQKFTGNGCRVLAFAYRDFSAPRASFAALNDDDGSSGGSGSNTNLVPALLPYSDFVFVGMISMQDPPRANVVDAISAFRRAGIKPMLITGDNPFTAHSFAQNVNIIPRVNTRESGELFYRMIMSRRRRDLITDSSDSCTDVDNVDDDDNDVVENKNHNDEIILGENIDSLTDEDWHRVFRSNVGVVFAETTAKQKLSIVLEARKRGYIIGVVGVGVNDAPALNASDVGIAMGLSGTSVARDAASIVLTSDDFASIVDGVREGRVLFDNLKKTIAYTLAHLLPEVIPVALTLLFGFPAALTSILILAIDLGTEMAPAISLAWEEGESDVMQIAPRTVKRDRLVSMSLMLYAYVEAGLAESIVCICAWLVAFSRNGVALGLLPFSASTQWHVGAPPLALSSSSSLSDTQQLHVVRLAQSVYWLTLVLSQVFHIWMVKSRRSTIFQLQTVANVGTNFAVLLELALMLVIIYVPGVQSLLQTVAVPFEYWAFSLLSFALLLAFTESRKFLIRRRPSNLFAKMLTW